MGKLLQEKGIVVFKEHKNASDEFVINDRVIKAQPERWTVSVLVGSMSENGLRGATFAQNVKVPQEVFDSCTFGTPCELLYELTDKGGVKPEENGFTLLKRKDASNMSMDDLPL